MTNDSIKGLQTRHVFLDTEIFRRFGYNLNHPVLAKILELQKEHVCRIHSTDITTSEIERQIGERALEVAQQLKKANKAFNQLQANTTSPAAIKANLPTKIDADTLKLEAIRSFSYRFIVEWGPIRHSATKTVSPSDIFEKYFSRSAPFDEKKGKEFPDAFVIEALDQWCKKNSEKMYVITNDAGMRRSAEQTSTLLPLPDLETFLALPLQDPALTKLVDDLLDKNFEEIAEAIENRIGDLGVQYSGNFQDGEAVDHYIGENGITLSDFKIISKHDENIDIVARYDVNLDVEIQYLDTSSAWWDSEDKAFVGGDTDTELIEDEVPLSYFISLNEQTGTIENVQLLTQEVNISEPYENYK